MQTARGKTSQSKKAGEMASRFTFPNIPNIYDPDTVTLARTTSQQNGPRSNGTSKSNTASTKPVQAMTAPSNSSTAIKKSPISPQRRHFVFADPVAFRYTRDRPTS
jgi:hypothetical protein